MSPIQTATRNVPVAIKPREVQHGPTRFELLLAGLAVGQETGKEFRIGQFTISSSVPYPTESGHFFEVILKHPDIDDGQPKTDVIEVSQSLTDPDLASITYELKLKMFTTERDLDFGLVNDVALTNSQPAITGI